MFKPSPRFILSSYVFSVETGFCPFIIFHSHDELKALDAIEYMFMFITDLDDAVQLSRFTMRNEHNRLVWSGFYCRGMERMERVQHPL